MNLVWLAILAIVAGDLATAPGPEPSASARASAPRLAANPVPAVLVSASKGHRPGPVPPLLSEGDARDADETEPTGLLDLDDPGPGLDDPCSWILPGESPLAFSSSTRPSNRPASFPLRC